MSHVDPGLNENWDQAAEELEHEEQTTELDENAATEDDTFLEPGRWWLASTGFPLIAGTFGPIANAFSICALAVKWRVWLPVEKDYSQYHPVPDPKWLIAVNAISLVLALAANATLLLTMARRLRFSIAQPITIVGWYTASIMLIALVCACSTESFRLEPRKNHALSQAYYYAIIAAGLYFIIASLLVFTVYGAFKGNFKKDFNLGPSQRTLMLQTISYTVYLLLGALVYSHIEGWAFLDAVYWSNFTLLTVGTGPLAPSTHAGRSLLIPYAVGGIVMVGLIVGSVRSLVLERAKEKMLARALETTREKAIASLNRKEQTIKLGWFETVKLDHDLSECDRREQEFRLMRRIQQKADRKRRYVALAMSTTAALILWFIGALVFWYTEEPQGWSYFVSLYFAFTTLLTLGYGDLVPSSFSGKPFYVFWTILAVPTLTILISHMGDTVIKAFSDLSVWLGCLTVLPEEGKGIKDTLMVGLRRLQRGKLFNQTQEQGSEYTAEDSILNCLVELLGKEELADAKEAEKHGDELERDTHFYHFVLAKEIRQLRKNAKMSPPRHYTYAEWAYYLRLVGHDESNPSQHKHPSVKDNPNKPEPDVGTAFGGKNQYAWSWLGVRSPLMSGESEAEWILERLTYTLEEELRKMHSSQSRHERARPPISMEMYLKRAKDKTNSSPSPQRLLQQGLDHAEVRRRHMNDGR